MPAGAINFLRSNGRSNWRPIWPERDQRMVPVTAEGVEDGEAVRRLREVGCDKAQGWHFGRPRSAEETRLILDAKGLVRRPLMAEPDVTTIPPELDVGRAA